MPYTHSDYTIEQRAVEIARAINELPGDDDYADVVALFNPGEQEVFRFLDEKPGSSCFWELHDGDGRGEYGRWHMRLRRCRNNRDSGLFDRLADSTITTGRK